MDTLAAFSCVVSIPAAGTIGWHKQALLTGLLSRLAFGPLGVLAAFALDGRTPCPRCAGPLNTEEILPVVCQHCGTELKWDAKQRKILGTVPPTHSES